MQQPEITLTEMDVLRLTSLLEQQSESTLEDEIERARVLDFPEVPADLVTMNTHFRYLNVTDGKLCEMTIVYPHLANTAERRISVLAPLGAALLGLRVGDEIDWTFPNEKVKRLRVTEIMYQPEQEGDLHL